jgi:hypothetical protein
VKSSWKPFTSERGLSIHLSKSPGCYAHFLQQHDTSTSTSPHVPFQPVLTNDPTAQILKKHWLMFNPGCFEPCTFEPSDNVGVSDFEDRDNDTISLSPNDDNSLLSDEEDPLHFDDNTVHTNDFEHFHEDAAFFPNEATSNASGHTSFTMSQKCLTSLLILLDSSNVMIMHLRKS